MGRLGCRQGQKQRNCPTGIRCFGSQTQGLSINMNPSRKQTRTFHFRALVLCFSSLTTEDLTFSENSLFSLDFIKSHFSEVNARRALVSYQIYFGSKVRTKKENESLETKSFRVYVQRH